MKKRLNRMLSTLLICSMVMTMMPTTVFATNRKDAVMEEYAGGLCEHHPEHDEECGYSEGIAGTACSHEHTDDCYREVIKCTHRHNEDCYPDMEDSVSDNAATPSDAPKRAPENCPHICDEDGGCVTKELSCQHEHNDECGYSPAIEGTPCGFVCEVCREEDNKKTATYRNNANVLLYAQYQKNKYTVTYTDGVDDLEIFPDQTYTVEENAVTPAFNGTPTRTGYSFNGWTPDVASAVTGNTTYIAKWTPNTYVVNFDRNGGEGQIYSPVQYCKYDQETTLLSSCPWTKTGYTFIGWNTRSDGTGAHYHAGQRVKNLTDRNNTNVLLYAQWQKNKYTVTYTDGVDGSEIFPDQKTEKLLSGDKTPAFQGTPTRTGYTFDGWNPEVADTVTANATYTAKWKANTYKVNFFLNYGYVTTLPEHTQNFTYGEEQTLWKCENSKSGIVFSSWNTKSDGSDTSYRSEQRVKNLTDINGGEINLYAQWKTDRNNNGIADDEEIKYTVRYTDGTSDRSFFPDQIILALLSGDKTPAFQGTPTRTGYTFDGWNPEVADTVTANATYTAKWKINIYTVTLNTNGGAIASGKDVTSYTYGEGAALPTANDMTREGYTFEGWYADSSFSGTPVTEISSDDMGNKEFYAKWMRNTTPIIPGDTVNYVVEHYKASDNGYTLEETEKLGDKIGSYVTAEPKIYTGYTYNPDAVGSVSMGTLKKISSAADIVTLKLYYDLTVYTVTVENDGNGSASAAPVSATMGEKITLTVTPNSGYRFQEWQIVSGDVTISGDVFTMPAGNVVVKAVFERKSSDGGGRDSSSDRDTSSSAIRKDPIKGRISSDRGIITGAANSTANDGYSHWMQNEHGWWLRFADNSYPKGRKHGTSGSAYAWEYINGSWWAFDENGYAKTGWLRDEAFGGWFYMDPERGMQTGWVLIDGVWYYFHPVSDGRRGIMYAGQKTPDGYYVDENGAWDGKEK